MNVCMDKKTIPQNIHDITHVLDKIIIMSIPEN